MRRRLKMMRIDESLSREMNEIISFRKFTIDKNFPKPISAWRLLNVAIKEPEWLSIKEKLKRVPRKEDLWRI